MKKKVTNKDKLARALWLVFQASKPVGMGFLHAADGNLQSEQSLFALFEPMEEANGTLRIDTDYVFGRMVKTEISIDKDGTLSIQPETPRYDYQSWARRYSSASEIIAEVEKSLA